jgi:hypothetical protein
MQLFILGMILGSGLVLAAQELRRQYAAFQHRRWIRTTDVSLTIAADDYCQSWCHDSQAEHDADVSWSDTQVKSATDDELRDRISQLADQSFQVWPGTKDTAW